LHTVSVEAISGLKENPIRERVDLSEITTLEVDAGWRDQKETAEFLQLLQKQFAELGHGHISLTPIHKLRRGMMIIDGVIYKVSTPWAVASKSINFICDLKSKLEPVLQWCQANCASKFILDQKGLHLFSDDDFVLFKLKFSIKDI
jgi:hypothetical protein